MDALNKKNNEKKICLIVTSVIVGLGVLILILALTLSGTADVEKKHVIIQTTTEAVPVETQTEPVHWDHGLLVRESLNVVGKELEKALGKTFPETEAYKSFEALRELISESRKKREELIKANTKSTSTTELDPRGDLVDHTTHEKGVQVDVSESSGRNLRDESESRHDDKKSESRSHRSVGTETDSSRL